MDPVFKVDPRRAVVVGLVTTLLLSFGVARADVVLAPPYDSVVTASSCTVFDAGECSHQAEADTATGEVELTANQASPAGGSVPGAGGAVASADFRVTHVLAEARAEVVYAATVTVGEAKATASGSTTGSRLAQTTMRVSVFHLDCPACSKGTEDPVTLAIHSGPTEIENEQVVISLTITDPEGGQVPAGEVLIVVRLEAFASSGGSDTGASAAKLEGAVTSVTVA